MMRFLKCWPVSAVWLTACTVVGATAQFGWWPW